MLSPGFSLPLLRGSELVIQTNARDYCGSLRLDAGGSTGQRRVRVDLLRPKVRIERFGLQSPVVRDGMLDAATNKPTERSPSYHRLPQERLVMVSDASQIEGDAIVVASPSFSKSDQNL